MILGSFVAGRSRSVRHARALPWTAMVMGSGLLLVAVAPGILPASIGLLLTGVSIGRFNVPLMTIMQTTVPPELRGRLMGVLLTVATAAMPLGTLAAGLIADAAGVRTAFATAAAVALTAGVVTLTLPRLREDLSGSSTTSAQHAVPGLTKHRQPLMRHLLRRVHPRPNSTSLSEGGQA